MADFSQVPIDYVCGDCTRKYRSLQKDAVCSKCGSKPPGWFLRFEKEVIRLDPGTEGTIHNKDILYYYRRFTSVEVAAKKYIQSRKGSW